MEDQVIVRSVWASASSTATMFVATFSVIPSVRDKRHAVHYRQRHRHGLREAPCRDAPLPGAS